MFPVCVDGLEALRARLSAGLLLEKGDEKDQSAFFVVRLSRGDNLSLGFCFVAPVCQSVARHFPGRASLVIYRDVSAAFL